MAAQQGVQNLREKMFSAKFLDVEQIVLNLINEINLAPIKAGELGDFTKANSVMQGMVLNLDAFVSTVLAAGSGSDLTAYFEKRGGIVDRWNAGLPKDPSMETVRELYKVNLEVLASERLFKMRRYTYFGFHWKRGMQANLDRLQEEEQVEGEERELEDES